MTKIILYGDPSDTRLTLPLCKALSEKGGVLYYGRDCISEYSAVSPEFTVFETDRLECCHADRIILIFKERSSDNLPAVIPGDSFCAVAEENCPAVKLATRLSLPVVTYGMSKKSCISVSSMRDSRSVISINSCLTLLSGKLLEPCEFTVTTALSSDGYILLPVCTVLILCEKFKNFSICI